MDRLLNRRHAISTPIVDEQLASTSVRVAATLEVHADTAIESARALRLLAQELRDYAGEERK